MKLRDLYPSLDTQEREALAKKVETQPGYLWQLSKQWRGKKPSIDLITRLAAADPRLTVAELVEEFSEAPVATARPVRGPKREHHTPTDKPSNRKGR